MNTVNLPLLFRAKGSKGKQPNLHEQDLKVILFTFPFPLQDDTHLNFIFNNDLYDNS